MSLSRWLPENNTPEKTKAIKIGVRDDMLFETGPP